MREARDFAKDTDPLWQRVSSLVRRMAITLTSQVLWQLTGFTQLDGTPETRDVEVFSGIGFYSRPPSSGQPEAIAVNAFDSKSPAIVATRDEKTRAAVAGGIAQDEAMMFNSKSVVYVKADGTIEIRLAGGLAAALLLLSDFATFLTLVPATAVGSGDAFVAAINTYRAANPNWPFGTKQLKAQ